MFTCVFAVGKCLCVVSFSALPMLAAPIRLIPAAFLCDYGLPILGSPGLGETAALVVRFWASVPILASGLRVVWALRLGYPMLHRSLIRGLIAHFPVSGDVLRSYCCWDSGVYAALASYLHQLGTIQIF
jgi:hypothetical protein